ncbi:MAG: hypothetical protein WC997_02480 [Porticoccaceae bacterium]
MSSAIAAAVGGAVVGSLLADDNGAEGANNAARDATQLQAEIAADQWKKYKEIYEPLERDYVAGASDFDSPEEYARAASDASATVASQFAKAKDRIGRTPGLDPSSGAYQASMVGLDLAQAANDATQQNVARMNVSDKAFSRQTAALGLGKGLDSAAASSLASSAQANLGLAEAGNAQGAAQAHAIGGIVEKGISGAHGWINKSGTKTSTTDAGLNNGFKASW